MLMPSSQLILIMMRGGLKSGSEEMIEQCALIRPERVKFKYIGLISLKNKFKLIATFDHTPFFLQIFKSSTMAQVTPGQRT